MATPPPNLPTKLGYGQTYLTQASINPNPVTPGIIQTSLFAQESVKRLGAGDFSLDSKEKIALKYPDCILVLFYTENTESHNLMKIWSIAAEQVAGPVFASCNILVERKVAEAFTAIRSDGSHPLHPFSPRGYPIIMVYRNGWPMAVYNGARAVQPIIDYALTLACQASYFEPMQMAGGVQAEVQMEMPAYVPYEGAAVKTMSNQYEVGKSVRGYDPNLPVTAVGSPEAGREAAQVEKEERGTPQFPAATSGTPAERIATPVAARQ